MAPALSSPPLYYDCYLYKQFLPYSPVIIAGRGQLYGKYYY